MKNRILSLFALLFFISDSLFGTVVPLTPKEQAYLSEHPVIKVGGEMDWAPFDFVGSDGEYTGIVSDYLQKISEHTGVRFDVVTGHDWLELLGMFKAGELDMLPVLFHSKQREAFVTFTAPYLELAQYFFVREENDEIYGIEDLFGKTLAVVEGYYTEDIIREKYPQVKLFPVENLTEGLNSLMTGKADAFIESLAPASYAIEQNYLTGIKAVNRADFAPAHLYMGVRKGNTVLRDILQKGLDSISRQERTAIRDKWVRMKPEGHAARLSPDELAWRKAHPVIRVGSGDDWAPFNFLDQKGEFQGVTKEFLELLEKKSGLKVDLHVGKWNEILQEFKAGRLDLLPAALYNKEREKFGDYLPAHISLRDFIYARSDDDRIRSFDDLNGKRLARIKGYATLDPYLPHLKNVTIVEVESTLGLISAVLNKKADAFLESPATINHVLRENMIGGLKSIVQTVSDPTTAHMLVKKGEPLLYSILKKSLDAVTPAERDEIFNKWIFIKGQSKSIRLSDDEKAWLREHKVLRFAGDPNWLPLEAFNDKGEYVGIVADYLKLIEDRLGIRFERIETRDFDESVQLARSGEIDVISEVVESDLKSHVTFTNPYIDNPLVIVMNEKQNYVDDLNAIKDKRIAVIKGYGYLPKLYEIYPDIAFEYVDNVQEGLSAVSTGKVDAFVGTFILSSYHISEMGLANIKIVGKTKVVTELGLGVRKDYAPLVGILNKVLASVDEPTRSEIFGRWIKQEYVEKIDYTLLWEIAGGALVILLIIGYWNRKLTAVNRQVEELNNTLEEKVRLKTAELQSLVSIFDKNVIASKADEKGNITYVSDAFCEISGYSREELIGRQHNIVRHPDMPKALFKELWETIKAGRIWHGEIKNRTKSGGFYWVDVTITPECEEGQQNCGYSAIRHDITDKKAVEELTLHLEEKVKDRTQELHRQSIFLNTIMDSQTGIVLTTDGETIKTVNRAFLDFYDWYASLDDFKKEYDCICDTFVKEDPKNGYLQKEMDGEKWIDYILARPAMLHKAKILRKGREHIFTVTAARIDFENEELFTASFSDITTLEEQKHQVDTILENIVFPMIITNKKSHEIVYANPFAYEQYETTKEELIGSDISVVYTDPGERSRILEALGKRESLQNYETQFKTLKGRSFDALLSLITIPYDGEESFLGLVTDITEQKDKEREIRTLHKNTKSSIEYAALIQHALIPDNSLIRSYFSDYFAIWHPRDVVGGDIYLFEELRNDDEALLMVIDCTGHGVPGAFVTMLVKAIERQIVGGIINGDREVSPADILVTFNRTMKHLLRQEDEDSVSNAGFDAGILYFNKARQIARYAGAEIPLFYEEGGEIRVIKGDRHSIGYKKSRADFRFTDHEVPIKGGMAFYLSTDGYLDQNGGEKGFPFGKKRFKSLLEASYTESMADQQEILLHEMQRYMKGFDKNDDVTVIGVRI